MPKTPKRRKFFIIEGQDGTGKATQVEKLVRKFLALNRWVKKISFPRYGYGSAKFVELYLKGEFGPPQDMDPRISSSFYTYDRFMAASVINDWLTTDTVIADRYTASNMAHQGGKIKDPQKRREFFHWLIDLEFNELKIPRPDLTLILSVPPEISFDAAKKRAIAEGRSQDGHEINFEHIESAAIVYKELTEIYPEEYILINCVENGLWLSPDIIHIKIWETIMPLL